MTISPSTDNDPSTSSLVRSTHSYTSSNNPKSESNDDEVEFVKIVKSKRTLFDANKEVKLEKEEMSEKTGDQDEPSSRITNILSVHPEKISESNPHWIETRPKFENKKVCCPHCSRYFSKSSIFKHMKLHHLK